MKTDNVQNSKPTKNSYQDGITVEWFFTARCYCRAVCLSVCQIHTLCQNSNHTM